MGALGDIINDAVDAATGKSSGTTLQDFLSHFSSSEGIWIKQIDPLATFDLTFKLYPTIEAETKGSKKKEWYEALGDSLVSSAKGAVKNLANNVTGGLLGSIMNSKVDIIDKHDNFEKAGTQTFLEYLAAANLLVGKEDWVGENAGQSIAPLELNLGLYCQEITVPQMQVKGEATSNSVIGDFPVNGIYCQTDTNALQMKFINTKVPLMERIFYPWMRETVLPYWSYNTQPYTTATITIDYTKHNDVKYIFCGCRPNKIEMQNANQQATVGNLQRNVTFSFDYMLVTSSLTNCESLEDKLLSTGKTLFNSASKLVGL